MGWIRGEAYLIVHDDVNDASCPIMMKMKDKNSTVECIQAAKIADFNLRTNCFQYKQIKCKQTKLNKNLTPLRPVGLYTLK